MNKIFRLFSMTLAGFITVFSVMTSTVQAQTLEMESLGAIGTTVVESIREGYEGSVVARMVGRSGARTPSGSKGIAFEILLQDKMNVKSTFSAVSTQLSESSIDQLADLVTVDKGGNVVEYIQCKNSTSDSGIDLIINQIKSGKYEDATIVATKESAELLTQAAEKEGLAAEIVDSQISEQTTIRIANKALANLTLEEVAATSNKAGLFAAAIGTSVSILESVLDEDSLEETIGEASIEAGKSYLSAATASATGELVSCGLAAAGSPTAASVVVPLIVVLGVGYGAYKGLDKLADFSGAEQKATECVEMIRDKSIEVAEVVSDKIENMHIKESIESVDVKGKFATAKNTVTEMISH